jgi:hypothetical protein
VIQLRKQRLWATLAVAALDGGGCVAVSNAAERDAPAPSALDAALSEADRRFVAGDLQAALEVLEPVCAQSDHPECAFSLGAIQHGLGHCVEALAHYRQYRALAPQGQHAADVAVALDEVESRCGAPKAPAAVAPPTGPGSATPAAADPLLVPSPEAAAAAPPLLMSAPPARHTELMVGSLALSGAAALGSVVFGVLAAQSAQHCARAEVYDQKYIAECEEKGPRYQGLWQGLALVSGGFLGVGLTLWWVDAQSAASLGVSAAGLPVLQLQRRF